MSSSPTGGTDLKGQKLEVVVAGESDLKGQKSDVLLPQVEVREITNAIEALQF